MPSNQRNGFLTAAFVTVASLLVVSRASGEVRKLTGLTEYLARQPDLKGQEMDVQGGVSCFSAFQCTLQAEGHSFNFSAAGLKFEERLELLKNRTQGNSPPIFIITFKDGAAIRAVSADHAETH